MWPFSALCSYLREIRHVDNRHVCVVVVVVVVVRYYSDQIVLFRMIQIRTNGPDEYHRNGIWVGRTEGGGYE